MHQGDEKCIENSGRKSGGKRQIGRPRRRWEDNIRMDGTEIVLKGVDCINLTQKRGQRRALVNSVMNIRVNILTT
jgi:hypothetical protein